MESIYLAAEESSSLEALLRVRVGPVLGGTWDTVVRLRNIIGSRCFPFLYSKLLYKMGKTGTFSNLTYQKI